jgi:hypothetical protein
MKRRIDWWAVIQVDREIARYYRWLVKREYWAHTAIHPDWLNEPPWAPHVSIVRGEEPRGELKKLWKLHDGKQVTLEYEHNPRYNGDTTAMGARTGSFWFVNVYCPEISYIRNELKLKTFYNSHLTFGRVYT